MEKFPKIILAVILIAAGVVLILSKSIPELRISKMWPLFMMIPVAAMAASWAREGKKAAGVVYPITLLTLLCVYFIWLNFNGWKQVQYTWPVFILAPGLSFFSLFAVLKEKGLLVPACILSGLGIFFLTGAGSFAIAAGISLTVAGIWIIVRSLKSEKEKTPAK